MAYGMSPSTIASSTPRTVTVCGVDQFAAVNVNEVVLVVPSVVSNDQTGIVTVAVGCVARRTVNVAAPPPSVVTRPAVGCTMMLGDGSLSRLMASTSRGSMT